MDVERPVEPTEPPRTLAAGGSAALSETQAPAGDVSGSVGDGVEIGTEALSLPEVCRLISASHSISLLDSWEEGYRWMILPSRHARRWIYLQPR